MIVLLKRRWNLNTKLILIPRRAIMWQTRIIFLSIISESKKLLRWHTKIACFFYDDSKISAYKFDICGTKSVNRQTGLLADTFPWTLFQTFRSNNSFLFVLISMWASAIECAHYLVFSKLKVAPFIETPSQNPATQCVLEGERCGKVNWQ